MAARRLLFVAAFAVPAVLMASCREPTEIRLVLSTNFDCNKLGATPGTTTISVAGSLGAITEPGSKISTCADGKPNDLGDLVLVPSGQGDDVAIEVVAGVGQEACAATGAPAGCVFAKRRIRFLKHTRLVLPIELHTACLGNPCPGDQTCVDGTCTSAFVDPGACSSGVCPSLDGGAVLDGSEADASPDGGAGDAAGDGAGDAANDIGASCGPIGNPTTTPKRIDCPLGNPTAECDVKSQHCCAAICASLTNLCGIQPIVSCDETADCSPGEVCCLSVRGNNVNASCSSTCAAGQYPLCKSSCECADCQLGAGCPAPTCGGVCR